MKLIVDTSIWSEGLRRREDQVKGRGFVLQELISRGEGIYLMGIILQELLQGIKEQSLFDKIAGYLDPFPIIEIKKRDYVFAANIYNQLKRKGIQISTVDALIAATSINNNCILFTADKDFTFVSKHFDLSLFPGDIPPGMQRH